MTRQQRAERVLKYVVLTVYTAGFIGGVIAYMFYLIFN